MKKIFLFLITTIYFSTGSYAANTFTLHTSSFQPNQAIPSAYTCDGKDISPELDWSAIPDKTKTFALIMTDVDTPEPFYHWVVYNIPKAVMSLPEGYTQLPEGVTAGKNSWSQLTYRGPCPPKGQMHRYVISLYALDTELKLPEGADAPSIIKAMEKNTLGSVKLNTSYRH